MRERKLRLPETYQPAKRRIKIPPRRDSDFWHLHAHSKFSYNDALSQPKEMVRVARKHGQRALALTDHGNMAGAVQLYQACRKEGLLPFPGVEAYLKKDAQDKKASRFHVGLVAFTTEGYEHLVKIVTKSHTRERFHHKPHVDFSDFAEWAERGWTDHIALTTGCFFGMLQQILVNQGSESAHWLLQTWRQWFPHLYVELQHHDILHEDDGVDYISDDEICEDLERLAMGLGLPTVITQDAHYCHPEEKPVHETLKRLVSWSEDPSESVFPGDGFHLASEEFIRGHYNSVSLMGTWDRGLDGLRDLYAKHSLVIPELESYHYNVPIVTAGDPLSELTHECRRQFIPKTAHSMNRISVERYEARLEEELEVIEATNMAGYLMLNKMIVDWMNSQGIFNEARGSASGSLICYLLGITQLDPLKEGLRYERFLSKDRTKPPDIDLDVDDSRRGEVIAMLSERFNVCQIGTWAEYSLHDDTGRGSLLVSYISRKRKEGEDPAKLGAIKKMTDLPRADLIELQALSEKKAYKSYGTHAGGLVITSTREGFERLVPTMLVASSDTTVTQYDMDDVEELGLLKEDILGQKSLRTLRYCTELLGHDPKDGLGWIPLDDKKTFRAIRQQKVDGVFQLEGWTARKGCREMKPKNIKDIRDLMALYRPATMDSGLKDVYVRRRAGWEKPPERHPALMKAFKETYGVPVLQDQVIEVLRTIGFTPEDLTKLLKAVKASNENIGNAAQVIHGYTAMFSELATKAGFDEGDRKFTWEAVEGFAKYGFNKAHATTYGLRAYRMAYLRTHHPLEFFTAILRVFAGSPQERDYILAAREAGQTMLKPDINISGPTWSIDRQRGAIRKGLVSVHGVGEKAANEIAANAPFKDIEDIIDRCDARAVNGGKNYSRDGSLNGVLGKLRDAGVLKSLGA